jgi:hypothetical protein
VGTAPEHLFYGQALLLAAWPEEWDHSDLALARLLDSAWLVTRGRPKQQAAITNWRKPSKPRSSAIKSESPTRPPAVSAFPGVRFSANFNGHLSHLADNIGQTWNFNSFGTQLKTVLTDYRDAFTAIGSFLQELPSQVSPAAQQQHNHRDAELDLLWWGQARYCHALAIPYRNLARTDAESALWWATYEAANLSLSLQTAPAAAYLVETLHSLDQDVFERKSLIQWIEATHAVLLTAGDKAPPVGKRLTSFVDSDALGLPVTWARLKAARKEPLVNVGEARALDVGAEVDRGEWVSWIFRELLLDLHLAGDS